MYRIRRLIESPISFPGNREINRGKEKYEHFNSQRDIFFQTPQENFTE